MIRRERSWLFKEENVEQNLLHRYSVPLSTLQCYLKENVTTKPLGHCSVLGVATELELVHYIKLMDSKLFHLEKITQILKKFRLKI